VVGWHLVLYSLGAFSNGFYINSRGSYVDFLANQTHSSVPSMGSFFLAAGIGSAVLSLPVGFLVDRSDAHRLLIAGLGVRAVACALVPLVTQFWELALDTLVIGTTLPLVGVTLRACTLWHFGHLSAGVVLNVVMGSFGGGSILAPFVYGWILEWHPLLTDPAGAAAATAGVNWITAAVSSLTMLLCGLLKSPRRDGDPGSSNRPLKQPAQPQHTTQQQRRQQPPPPQQQQETAYAVLRALEPPEDGCPLVDPVMGNDSVTDGCTGDEDAWGAAGEGSGSSSSAAHSHAQYDHPGALSRSIDNNSDGNDSGGSSSSSSSGGGGCCCVNNSRLGILVVLAVYLGLSVGAECTVGGWVVSYAVSTNTFTTFEANVLASGLWIAFTAARFAYGSLVVCVRPEWILLFGHLACLAGTAPLLVLPAATVAAASPALVWVFALTFGVGIASFFPNAMGLGRRLFNFSAFEQSFFELAAAVGNGLVPALAGWLQSAAPSSSSSSNTTTTSSGGGGTSGGGSSSSNNSTVTGGGVAIAATTTAVAAADQFVEAAAAAAAAASAFASAVLASNTMPLVVTAACLVLQMQMGVALWCMVRAEERRRRRQCDTPALRPPTERLQTLSNPSEE
jgi:fucose permease